MAFEIIVHYPISDEIKCELERHVAEVHAHAVTKYIQRLPCPKGQKIALIKTIQSDIKSRTTED